MPKRSPGSPSMPQAAGGGWAGGHAQLRNRLARVLQAAGLTVVEIERPRRGERRRGKSDPIDAHLAALHALRLDADRLPTPRADGDVKRYAFCWALAGNSPQPRPDDQSSARVAAHRQRRRPSAVPRGADRRPAGCDHAPPRRSTRDPRTAVGARRPAASRSQSAGSTESSPITRATSQTWSRTWRRNCWPNAAWARSAPPSDRVLVPPGPLPQRAAYAALAGAARSPPAAAASSVTGSTAAATATSTAPCTTSA